PRRLELEMTHTAHIRLGAAMSQVLQRFGNRVLRQTLRVRLHRIRKEAIERGEKLRQQLLSLQLGGDRGRFRNHIAPAVLQCLAELLARRGPVSCRAQRLQRFELSGVRLPVHLLEVESQSMRIGPRSMAIRIASGSPGGIHSIHQVAPASATARIVSRSRSQSSPRLRPPTTISNAVVARLSRLTNRLRARMSSGGRLPTSTLLPGDSA